MTDDRSRVLNLKLLRLRGNAIRALPKIYGLFKLCLIKKEPVLPLPAYYLRSMPRAGLIIPHLTEGIRRLIKNQRKQSRIVTVNYPVARAPTFTPIKQPA